MFGIFDSVVDSVSRTVDDFIDDPVGQTVYHATSPIRDAAEIIDGLTEGEIRGMAVARLGADVAAGMAISEIIEVLELGE
ncbi:hypothetical protein KVP40.0224 [Vibrio phage KVP40]|uniref:Uncharacterized protein n=3 Tax=Schizotequatrovirus KVP40 TaxID=1914019 RepID=Q6WHT0_BPKVM|nr:hypothetical protein KVP40.0224 [Vibrio phage KVP40]AFN37454.1 hypothetical protein pp2_221 [Vibrio phage phi-pp2]QIW91190.1 hypothetical protein COHAPHLL_00354 [Vibrio phage V09]UNA01739.1 hypothetical protein [Vibrio phage PC-Liy1]URQ03035.1 hypothetical protein PVA8_49 [Vibrio phage PVA8]WBM58771.1 hypothetical protein vBValMPVA8_49 [Vibrio phage vB_ValM_PVA8]